MAASACEISFVPGVLMVFFIRFVDILNVSITAKSYKTAMMQ